ncbi:MAG TPA: MraY family glycosyltransferase, partial [Candidatus Dojkabacteria bacterium]|nr:MraY family glycosyltransferase [Candidatus Dojkabacteria bacterium]
MIETTQLLQTLIQKYSFYSFLPTQYLKYVEILPIVLIAFFAALLLTPIIGQLAIKFKITDDPTSLRKVKANKFDNPERHIHKKSIPYLGGLAVLIPLIVGLLLFFRTDDITIPLLVALLILCIAGILDDTLNLPPQIQLALQILASTIIVGSVADLTFINNPFGGIINLNFMQYNASFLGLNWRFIFIGDLLIVPWIILCINAVKWVGGSDGLMEGNMLIAYILLMLLGIREHNVLITILSAIMSGGLSAFLIFNFPPAKIFSGSTGKTVFGFLIATLAFIQGAKFATAILILALPLIDS